MSLGLHEERRRRRRKARWALIRWTLALLIVMAVFYVAYETGSVLAAKKVRTLQGQIETLTASVNALRRDNAEREAAVEAQRLQAEEWQRRYERDVPRGEIKALFDQVREKLETGVDADRLRFVIRAVQNERVCADDLVTKRFIVRTPLYRGSQDSIGFADGALTVTAEGPSARTEDGRPQGWFDPEAEITVRITHIGGAVEETVGTLPIQHSMVVGDREYRFNVLPGARGFVEVSSDSCAYP